MSKIVMLADIHLGVGTRLKDIMWSLRAVANYCALHDIDTVVVLGDLYHDRESINIDVLCDSFEFFRWVKGLGQKWIVFPGNHDMFLKRSWNYSSIDPLADLVTIIDDIKILQLDDRRFWIVPFIYSEAAYMRVIGRIMDQYEKDDVLLTHIGVRKAMMNVCFLLQDWSTVDFKKTKFDQIFCGHFHTHQKVNENLWYIGSIIPFKFDEGDVDHGFVVYDLKTREHEFVSIWETGTGVEGPMPPQYCTFHDELLEDKTRSDVANCMIRIAMTREYSQNEKDIIRDKFMDWGARKINFFDFCDETDPEVRKERAKYTIPASRLFLKWLKEDKENTKGLNQSLLKRLNNDIVQEGDERYQKSRLEE